MYPEVECPVCRTKIPLDKVHKARVLRRNSEYATAPTVLILYTVLQRQRSRTRTIIAVLKPWLSVGKQEAKFEGAKLQDNNN